MCRPGSSEQAWGQNIDTRQVADEDEQKAALADGWYLAVGDWDKAPAPAPEPKPKLSLKTEEAAK